MLASVRKPRRAALAALVVAGAAALVPAAGAQARTRDYWVAAVPRLWNIAPNGQDAITATAP